MLLLFFGGIGMDEVETESDVGDDDVFFIVDDDVDGVKLVDEGGRCVVDADDDALFSTAAPAFSR